MVILFSLVFTMHIETYKRIMGYKWASIYCSNTNFILKTDDDVYVNIKGLLRTVYANQAALLRSVAGICSLESRRDTNRRLNLIYHHRNIHSISTRFVRSGVKIVVSANEWLSKWVTTCALIMLSRYEATFRLSYRTRKYNLQLKEQQPRMLHSHHPPNVALLITFLS